MEGFMKFKKVISLIAAVLVSVSALSLSVSADSAFTKENQYFILGSQKLSPPKNVHAIYANKAITISWDEVSGASSYVIKGSTDKRSWQTFTETSTSITLEINGTQKLYYKIASEGVYGVGEYSEIFCFDLDEYVPPAPENINSTVTSSTMKITWDTMPYAAGYIVKYSTDKKNWTTKSTTKNQITLQGLKPDTKYYYKVASKRKNDTGKFSKTYVKRTEKKNASKLSESSATLWVDDTYTLTVSNSTNKEVKWSSSDKSVATVTSGGVVKGIGAGECTITAKVDNKKLKCNVTVRSKYYPDTNIPDMSTICEVTQIDEPFYAEEGGIEYSYYTNFLYSNTYEYKLYSERLTKDGFEYAGAIDMTDTIAYAYINESFVVFVFVYTADSKLISVGYYTTDEYRRIFSSEIM